MKKLLALILVLVMIFSMASCTLLGGNDTDKNDGTNDNGNTDNNDNKDEGLNNPFPGNGDGIDLPLVDIEPDGID